MNDKVRIFKRNYDTVITPIDINRFNDRIYCTFAGNNDICLKCHNTNVCEYIFSIGWFECNYYNYKFHPSEDFMLLFKDQEMFDIFLKITFQISRIPVHRIIDGDFKDQSLKTVQEHFNARMKLYHG